MDRAGQICEVNERAAAMFGWSHDELVGQQIEVLVPGQLRARHEGHRGSFGGGHKARPMGIGLELRALRKDGSDFPVEISLAGFNEDNDGPLVVATVRDVTERARLRDFGKGAVRATEEERQRIARELHDETSQHLAAILIRLRLAQRTADPATQKLLEQIRDDLSETSEGVRRIARALRPPELEDAGLAAALQAHARSIREASSLPLAMDVGAVPPSLSTDTQLAIYRVVQEALGNALRHSGASAIGLRLRTQNGRLVVEVWDDGKGFDVEAQQRSEQGLGLLGMAERAASAGAHLDIQSTSKGTRVTLNVPIPDLEATSHE